MAEQKFTAEQLADFAAYERVRASGRFNMIMDIGARQATRLSPAEYGFVMNNFEALRAAALAPQSQEAK